ncbi:GAF domain-containing sensor histidine kinase [Nocardioides antri]|uniref:histidine kinase n=1 Tax=Nocardioides antri TaxID=2607659 RepID=A0A5B1M510_9ACTN|nr:ATP-binding protein [Nocardioides antri]KAA1427229.1 hypothetical protein F0U47_06910 [Nocardioides antri]
MSAAASADRAPAEPPRPPAADDDAPSPVREVGVAVVGLVVLGLVGYGAWLGLHVSNLHNGLLALTFTAVGLYVLRMRPGHRIGLLFVVAGVQSAVMYFGRQYGLHDDPLPAGDWLAWFSIWQIPISMAVVGLSVMIFPTGRLLSPRWRVAATVMVVLCVLLAVASALWPIEDDWRSDALEFPFEFGMHEEVTGWLEPVQRVGYQALLVLWVAAVVVRIRRASGDETRQLRWFVSAVAVMAVVLTGGLVTIGSAVPGLIATALVPVAAGVAILKYRLYGIDPVINKAIVVGVLALAITAGYVAVVVGVGRLLPVGSGILSLAATALVAVAFEPVRRRAQGLADRLVYGHRATPYETLAQLSAQLDEGSDALLDGIAATVAKGVGATMVEVWVGDDDALTRAAAWPEPAGSRPRAALADLGGRRRHVLPVVRHGEVRGAIVVAKPAGAQLTQVERQLLVDLVAQTGLVIDHQAQEQQLRAAARRIVTAADEARRRIERDLHDGAQQRLVALSIDLAVLAERAEAVGAPDLAARASSARAGLAEATTELRELARGVHPTILTESGLAAAIDALADRATVPVRVDLDLDGRPPPEAEVTAYFVVAEALTNAARHAHATAVEVSVARVDDCLRVAVTDDGVGGADPGRGTGLQGLADRLRTLGGTLSVVSRPGRGSTISAVIPCG